MRLTHWFFVRVVSRVRRWMGLGKAATRAQDVSSSRDGKRPRRKGARLVPSTLAAGISVYCSFARAQGADTSEASTLRDLDRFGDEPAAADSGKPRTPISETSLEELLRAYSHEPKVEQVVAAALEAAKHDPAKYAEMAGRARLRGLLPHIDLGARRGQGIDLRWTPTEDLDAHRTTADDITLFATLRFDLDRLMFTGEEVSIAREARSAKNAEHQLIRAVVHVYFLRRRLMLERDMLAGSSIAQQLRIQEAEALLDAFTDGAFQRMLKDGKHKAWRTGASTNASERR